MALRIVSAFVLGVLAAGASGCCKKVCQKDPPCRPCENPCCLTPIQKVALGKSTHALGEGPLLHTYEGKTFVLFSEKGRDDFQKDAAAYKERGALRLFKQPGVFYVDLDPGEDFDWAWARSNAVPYTPSPPPQNRRRTRIARICGGGCGSGPRTVQAVIARGVASAQPLPRDCRPAHRVFTKA